MLGKKEKTSKLFYLLSIEQLVPLNHLLRRVTAVVDFSFVRRRTAQYYSAFGKPSIDPEVLFKMSLIGWLYGITSERRLAEDISLHLAYRWFLGYDFDEPTPNHSVLSKARRRFGLWEYQAFFDEVVRQCRDAGLIQGDHLYVDSTLIKANASLDSLTSRVLLTKASDFVQRLFTENPVSLEESDAIDEPIVSPPTADPSGAASADDEWTGAPLPPPGAPVEIAPQPEAPEGPVDPVSEVATVAPPDTVEVVTDPPSGLHLLCPTDTPTTRSIPLNTALASRTDPDAAYISRDGVARGLYYKFHVGTDGGPARVITAIIATGAAVSDDSQLVPILTDHEQRTGARIREATADTTYGTAPIYEALLGAGVVPSIPMLSAAYRHPPTPTSGFVYDPIADQFTCPTGKVLRPNGTGKNGSGIVTKRYRTKKADCVGCPLKASCNPGNGGRAVTRPVENDVLHTVEALLKTRRVKIHIAKRKVVAEGSNAEIKDRHGVRRTSFRYQPWVQVQAYGVAIGYNVKKLVKACAPLSRNTGVLPQCTASVLLASSLPRFTHQFLPC